MKKKLFKVLIASGHIFVEEDFADLARRRAVEIVHEIEMPKKVLWKTDLQRIRFENTSAYEVELNVHFDRFGNKTKGDI